jgi:hypothetical protein
MGRKSSIDRLPTEVRSHIERRLRENRLTLDELIQDLQQSFPSAKLPSRSALGRKRQGFEEMAKSLREIDAAATALVAELGEDFDDRSGALLAQAVTTLASNAAFGALQSGEAEIKDVLDLARAAKSVQETRSLSLKERQSVAKEARERLIAEQREKLDELGKAGAIDQATLNKVIKAAYGL